MTREGLLTCGASRTPPPTIVAVNLPPACRGRACPARSLTAHPFCGSSVGRNAAPLLILPHLYRGVVGAAGEVGVKVDQAVGIRRVTVLLDITIRYKHPTIAGQGQGGRKQGQILFHGAFLLSCLQPVYHAVVSPMLHGEGSPKYFLCLRLPGCTRNKYT